MSFREFVTAHSVGGVLEIEAAQDNGCPVVWDTVACRDPKDFHTLKLMSKNRLIVGKPDGMRAEEVIDAVGLPLVAMDGEHFCFDARRFYDMRTFL